MRYSMQIITSRPYWIPFLFGVNFNYLFFSFLSLSLISADCGYYDNSNYFWNFTSLTNIDFLSTDSDGNNYAINLCGPQHTYNLPGCVNSSICENISANSIIGVPVAYVPSNYWSYSAGSNTISIDILSYQYLNSYQFILREPVIYIYCNYSIINVNQIIITSLFYTVDSGLYYHFTFQTVLACKIPQTLPSTAPTPHTSSTAISSSTGISLSSSIRSTVANRISSSSSSIIPNSQSQSQQTSLFYSSTSSLSVSPSTGIISSALGSSSIRVDYVTASTVSYSSNYLAIISSSGESLRLPGTSNSSASTLSTGAIIGIVIAALIIGFLFALLVFCCFSHSCCKEEGDEQAERAIRKRELEFVGVHVAAEAEGRQNHGNGQFNNPSNSSPNLSSAGYSNSHPMYVLSPVQSSSNRQQQQQYEQEGNFNEDEPGMNPSFKHPVQGEWQAETI